jgi:hypothetical protein
MERVGKGSVYNHQQPRALMFLTAVYIYMKYTLFCVSKLCSVGTVDGSVCGASTWNAADFPLQH